MHCCFLHTYILFFTHALFSSYVCSFFFFHQTINDTLEELKAPVRVCSGRIGKVTVTVPWVSLLKSSSVVEVSELNIVVKPSLVQYGDVPSEQLLMGNKCQLLSNNSDTVFWMPMSQEIWQYPSSNITLCIIYTLPILLILNGRGGGEYAI